MAEIVATAADFAVAQWDGEASPEQTGCPEQRVAAPETGCGIGPPGWARRWATAIGARPVAIRARPVTMIATPRARSRGGRLAKISQEAAMAPSVRAEGWTTAPWSSGAKV